MTLAGKRIWRTVAECLSGGVALALLTFVCFRFHLNLATAVCLYLTVIVWLSLKGSFISSVIVSLIAVGCLAYYFAPPIFSFRVNDGFDFAAIIVFLTTATVITRLVSRVRKTAEEILAESEERKRAEEALRTSEEQWRNAFENNPTMYFLVEPSGGILSVNPFGAERLGYTVKELVGQSVLKLFYEADREAAQRYSAVCLERLGESMSWELRKVRKDGTMLWVRETARAVPGAQKKAILLIACEDITERRRAEEGLKQSEAYLAEAQRLSHTGSWAWTADTGEIRYWSEECYRVLGFDPSGGLPRYQTYFERIHPDDQPSASQKLKSAKRDRAEFELDYRIIHTGGEIRDVHLVGHPAVGPSGDLVEFVGTVIDVTERKRAEEERETLRQAQADLARVNRVTIMGELTASLAHEVNQPIAAAVTNANTCLRWLTRDHPDLEQARESASRIVKDATRAADIVSRIRSQFKKGTPERELVDVNEVIREMIVLLRSETIRYSISIRTDLAVAHPIVIADRVHLQQVFMNLMLNGIEAMKDMDAAGELTIKLQRAEDGQLLISVSDTGVGLPPQQADQIFNAFFTTKAQGTGMGLSISRSIVESHGGRLWATANKGRGATFHVTLPAQVEAHE